MTMTMMTMIYKIISGVKHEKDRWQKVAILQQTDNRKFQVEEILLSKL